jgi:hypothetical protein
LACSVAQQRVYQTEKNLAEFGDISLNTSCVPVKTTEYSLSVNRSKKKKKTLVENQLYLNV